MEKRRGALGGGDERWRLVLGAAYLQDVAPTL